MVWHLDMLCLLLALGCLQAWTLGSCVERVTDTITLDATDVSVLHVTNPLVSLFSPPLSNFPWGC